MSISSHCTIGKHAYGTCLNGYVHFSSLFLCAIKANYEKCNIRGLSIKYVDFPCNSGIVQYFKTKFLGLKIKLFLELWFKFDINTMKTFKVTKS